MKAMYREFRAGIFPPAIIADLSPLCDDSQRGNLFYTGNELISRIIIVGFFD